MICLYIQKTSRDAIPEDQELEFEALEDEDETERERKGGSAQKGDEEPVQV